MMMTTMMMTIMIMMGMKGMVGFLVVVRFWVGCAGRDSNARQGGRGWQSHMYNTDIYRYLQIDKQMHIQNTNVIMQGKAG